MKKQLFYWLGFGLILTIGCQKEKSFENGNTPSDGSLQADVTGDCLPKTVNGAYIANTALVAATNTITVQVNVNTVGNYEVYTDTVNGYYFRASGVFTTTGATNVTLRGIGTPFSAGVNNFIVNYDSTQCDLAVTVLPAGTGSAVYTLAGAGGSCSGATVQGTYAVGVALSSTTNVIVINTNVTTIGTYTITTTYQGMTFAASGAFTSTGINVVTLSGTGTPTTGGANVVPITAGSTTCSFTVTVGSGAVGTLGGAGGACTPSTVNGTYTVGAALTGTNTVQVQINVTTAGSYNITSDTQAGFSFALAGTATVGTSLITLVGAGTPTASGSKTFTVTFGSSTCTFTVNVQAAAGGAVGTLGGAPNVCTPATVNGTYTMGTALTAGNTVQVQITTTVPGSYIISSDNQAGFSFSGSGTATLGTQLITLAGSGTPTSAGAKTFTVTFGASTCTFTVTVQPSSGGAAAGTLGGAPNVCSPSTVNGWYYNGTAVTASNTVTVQLNVTTAGTYTISTNTVAGISFSGSGNVAVGNQNVTLASNGTPSAQGPQVFTVTWGTSTCTFIVWMLSSDYFPRVTNNNWSYENNDVSTDSLYRNVIANTLSANGNTYNIFMAKDGTPPEPDSSGYYRKSGGDYFEWIDIAGLIGYDPPAQWAEYILLKDASPVGTSWNSAGVAGTYQGTPLNLRFKYSIDQVGASVPITSSTGTVTYQNVIVVKEEYEQFTGGVWVNVTSQVGYGKSYYAKGIGLIKYEAFNGSNVSQFLEELRRWQVF